MPRFLILGQGLAGTLLAAELLQAGCSVFLADPAETNTSSRVAAGMIHPVTGRRLTKSWRVDEFLPFAIKVYRSHESFLGTTFYHEIKTLELYKDVANSNEWMSRSTDPSFLTYMGDACPPSAVPDGIEPGLGGQYLNKGGWLDTSHYLSAWRNYFTGNGLLVEAEIDESEITFVSDKAYYKNEIFDFVVDCRGAATARSKWFGHLPFNMAKGEVLLIACSELKSESILNKAVKLIPSAREGEFICGATFSWDELDNIPTEAGKNELTAKIDKLLLLPYRILQHRAGVRPATADRRPFIGQHTGIKPLYILNGFGSKGVLLGPWMARTLKEHLLNNAAIPDELNIRRLLQESES